MSLTKDHPTIRRIEATGYPKAFDSPAECPRCSGLLDDYVFLIEGEECCVECFKDHVTDYVSTNPREAAKALGVPYEYRG